MKSFARLRAFIPLVVLGFLVFIPSAQADTGEFKVSDYGSGATSSVSSQYWRGYHFQVSETTEVTDLIGGGVGGDFSTAIYQVTVATGAATSTVTPTKALAFASSTASTANQVTAISCVPESSECSNGVLTLTPGVDYLLAAGKTSAASNANNQFVVTSINIDNLLQGAPRISLWDPNNPTYGLTYRWDGRSGNYTTILNRASTDIKGDSMPMLGFRYNSNINAPEVTTEDPTFSGDVVTSNGSLIATGGGDTTVYIEYGTQSNLSGTTYLNFIDTVSAEDEMPFAFEHSTTTTAGTWYYRAVAINEQSTVNGAIKSFVAHSLKYIAGANGSLTGRANQVVYDGEDGNAITAVANTGYRFVKWSDDSTQNPRTDTSVDSNVNVTATFEELPDMYTITSSANTGGIVNPTGEVLVEDGNDQTFTISANSGYVISDVVVDGESLGVVSSYTFSEVNDDHTISVVFTKKPSSGGKGGSVSGGYSASRASVSSNSSATSDTLINQLKSQIAALLARYNVLNNTSPVNPTETVLNNNLSVRDLDIGMEGDDVRSLQTLLMAEGYAIPAGATGYFAGQTQSALAKYQSAHGIVPAVGYFGPVTRTQMKSAGLTGLWW